MPFQYSEIPSGTINSSNVTFTVANVPTPLSGLMLYQNGLLQKQGTDYSIANTTITFVTAPTTGDSLLAFYQYGGYATSTTANSTITLQSVANFFSTQADLLPLTGIGGYTNEPFLTIANDSLSDLISDPSDWKFNRQVMPFFVTCPNKQDYQFAGASAFSLSSTCQGWAIDLASSSAITVTAGVVTVRTIEAHRFAVGDVIYLNNVTMATGTASKYNSTFTDNGNTSAWSGGYTITTIPTTTSFTFAAATGQNNADVGGAPGIINFAYGTSASCVQMVDSSSPQGVRDLSVKRELPVASQVNNPTKIAVMTDAGTGVLTIRFDNVPGTTTWGATLVYQARAPIKADLNATWAPFPDHLSSVYRQAVLYRMRVFLNQPTQEVEWKKLQAAIQKALGFTGTESTDISIQPEDPLMDDSVPSFFFN